MNESDLGPEWDPQVMKMDKPGEGLVLNLVLASHQASAGLDDEECPEPGTITTPEAIKAMNTGRVTAVRVLESLMDRGLIERVRQVRRLDPFGRLCRPVGWKLTQKGLEEGPDILAHILSQNGPSGPE